MIDYIILPAVQHTFCFLFVGVVYFTLGNILPQHRSQTIAIQLLAIATNPIIKKYGIDAILEPFLEDLQKLEQVSYNSSILCNVFEKENCIFYSILHSFSFLLLRMVAMNSLLRGNLCHFLVQLHFYQEITWDLSSLEGSKRDQELT